MREADVGIREANRIDIPTICALLKEVQLATSDILADSSRYWVAEDKHGQLTGVVGLELGKGSIKRRFKQ